MLIHDTPAQPAPEAKRSKLPPTARSNNLVVRVSRIMPHNKNGKKKKREGENKIWRSH
ncbi:unnamed protein product [Sphenostylis stenocarpa]|uniref:Uncharacterized protein n=1 Tax=Sphenostylis stenocarpa TaxID=92480 RepID=A0AA86V3Z9_9FABA|nr:unnamed protein product [Sphenostylis stenocarpa]